MCISPRFLELDKMESHSTYSLVSGFFPQQDPETHPCCGGAGGGSLSFTPAAHRTLLYGHIMVPPPTHLLMDIWEVPRPEAS